MSLKEFIRIQRKFLLEQQSLVSRQLQDLEALERASASIDHQRNSSVDASHPSNLQSGAVASKSPKKLTSEEKRLLKEEKMLLREEQRKLKSEKVRKKKESDPNKPKRPVTAFLLYSTDELPKLRDKLKGQGISHRDMMVKLGAMWTALPAEQKQKYIELGERDKEEYSRKMEIYKNSKEMEPNSLLKAKSQTVANDRVHAAQRVLAPILESLEEERTPLSESEKKRKKKKRHVEESIDLDEDQPDQDRTYYSLDEDLGDEVEKRRKKKKKSKHHHRHHDHEIE